MLSDTTSANLKRWTERADARYQEELAALATDETACSDAFFQDLEFGTAGLRGILGAGPNRMNIHTVGKATQGLANYLNERFEYPTVAIARDSRHGGLEFCQVAAGVLAANGVKLLYGTSVCAAHKTDGKIDALIVENKSGRYAIGVSGSVVDCTGDADICKLSGAATVPFSQGNVLAAWHYFLKNGVPELRMLGFADIPDKQKTGNEEKPLISRRFSGLDGKELRPDPAQEIQL